MRRPVPSRREFSLANPEGGRPPKHGGKFVFDDPATWGVEQVVTAADPRLCGTSAALTAAAVTLAIPRRTASRSSR